MTVSNLWLLRRPGAARLVRLYCFSYAGGQAGLFMPWQAALEPYVEVCGIQLPGRGIRVGEPFVSSLESAVEQIAQAVHSQTDGHFAFFGHSLGALLAFEVTRYCARHRMITPLHLFVSGCEAPRHRTPLKKLHLLPDHELLRALADYNGTPKEVLENQELMTLALPSLRADFALAHEYIYRAQAPLTMPMTVLGGLRDSHGSREKIEKWAEETEARHRVFWFDGDHFFINTHQAQVLNCVRSELLNTHILPLL